MKILVTGFNRFGRHESNPTEQMIPEVRQSAKSLAGCEVIAEVLETEFERAGRRIEELLATHEPEVVLGFGVSSKAQTFLLERFALNIDDAREPDNAGRAPAGLPIVPGGPAAYASTLPLAEIFSSLEAAGIPVGYSNHAGTYVCNHVFYLLCHHSSNASRGRLYGFIHVPLALGPPDSVERKPSTPAETAAGVLACIDAVRRFLDAQRLRLP